MTPQTALEVKGNFLTHPCAELIAEIAAAQLSGSLRVENKDRKCVLYFKTGRVVFAVSNARSSRLFAILLQKNRLQKEDLTQIADFENDLRLAAALEDKGFFTKAESAAIFAEQIEAIIVGILGWPAGEWTFSSLARIRDGLTFDVDATQLLVDYARCLPEPAMLGRFRSLDETFRLSAAEAGSVILKPEEAFVLSRADEGTLSAADLVSVAGMSETSALHLIYILWLGGLLVRDRWQPAFSPETVRQMRGAKLELRREAKQPAAVGSETVQPESAAGAEEVQPKEPEVKISLDDYLERVENAETHYDTLGVDSKATIDELKRAYFGLAKMFHPDIYHSVGGVVFARVQRAFTNLAQAHETLKSTDTREVYDYRMRKELAERAKREAAGGATSANGQIEQAAENFERGFELLMDEENEAALPLLARAVHFAPQNARYHAYYGKALSADTSHRHKAEAEMQAAIKLDPNNPVYKILLAEFFIQNNLMKRAEGELTRLLAAFPSNREAQTLLAGIRG